MIGFEGWEEEIIYSCFVCFFSWGDFLIFGFNVFFRVIIGVFYYFILILIYFSYLLWVLNII